MTALTLEAVVSILQERNAIIVHCSPRAEGGIPSGQRYPEDLRFAIKSGWEQCCSTTEAQDDPERLWGDIGIVVKPLSAMSVKAADAHDAGARRVGDLLDVNHPNPTLEDFIEAVVERHKREHNEIVLRDFQVVGIYIHPNARMVDYLIRRFGRHLEHVREMFRELPIYSSNGKSFVLCLADGGNTEAGVDTIYGWPRSLDTEARD